jgi:hypothetical protein
VKEDSSWNDAGERERMEYEYALQHFLKMDRYSIASYVGNRDRVRNTAWKSNGPYLMLFIVQARQF